ncbi:MAG: PIG-L family deacetylase [Firmicutes bacterium]|nr:PIG-L family deacetylase [Bacillota bacterium]
MKLRKLLSIFAGLVLLFLIILAYNYSIIPTSPYTWLSEAYVPGRGDRVLVFAPHPDDETIAAGGYISRSVQAGALLKIVLVTDGNRHGLEAKRYQEFRTATGLLGVALNQLSFWGYPDGKLERRAGDLEVQVDSEMRGFKPTVVVYPHPADRHPDHAVLGRVVEKLLPGMLETDPTIVPYRYLVHYRQYPRYSLAGRPTVLLPPPSLLGIDQQWMTYRLTPEEKMVKRLALDSYRTQLKNPFLRPLLHNLLRDNELMALRKTIRKE